MAHIASSTIAARFLDVDEEPTQTLLSIRGYEKEPLLPLEQAVQPIQSLLNHLDTMVCIAKRNSRNPSDGLTVDESAAIHLYTMQWDEPDISLHTLLNRTLRAVRRESLRPWFSYMKLFFTALYKLPSVQNTIWRGIRGNVCEQYHNDHVWWGVSSCTSTVEIVEQFIGSTGTRTLFAIECFHGKSIRAHSYYQAEDEIILLPGSYFRVVSKLNPSKDLHIIHLRETKPAWETISPPFDSAATTYNLTHPFVSQNTIGSNVNDLSDDFTRLPNPYGSRIDDDENVYIADYETNRILKWKCGTTKGYVIIDSVIGGNRTDRLNGPTDVIIDHNRHSLIISDSGHRRIVRFPLQSTNSKAETIVSDISCGKLAIDNNGYLYMSCFSECAIKRWRPGETYGTVVAGGNGKGDRSNQFDGPDHLYIDRHNSIHVVDVNNHRVMKWIEGAREGILVAGGHREGRSLNQLAFPQGVIVDQMGTVYVSDTYNNRIVKWPEGSTQGRIVADGSRHGGSTIQLNKPKILIFDRHGHLYVVGDENSRLQRISIESNP